MDKTSSSQKSSFIASTLTKQNEKHATQTSNDLIGQFSRFNIAEIDAEPKIPETKTTDAEQSTRVCTLIPTNEQKKQEMIVACFVEKFLDLAEKIDINLKNTDFFLEISSSVNYLIKKIKKHALNVNDVIKNITGKLIFSNASIKHITTCSRLLKSAQQYEKQIKQLSLFLGVSAEDKKQYIQNIYKLFIEGDILYPRYNDFNKNTNDKGPYVFEDEKSYMNHNVDAFCYTVKELLIDNKKLCLQQLDNIIKIFNTKRDKKHLSHYMTNFNQKYSREAVNLLAQGKIAKYIVIDDINNALKLEKDVWISPQGTKGVFKVERDKHLVEDYINSKLDENTSIALKQSEADPDYYTIDKILIKSNNETTILGSDILEKQACIFEPLFSPQEEDLLVYSSFDNKYDQEEYAKSLITTYYNETAHKQTDLEYATSVMKFAGSLQRAHIYQDCNGRMTFFNLVPVLLMKHGLWVTRQPFNLWDMIDSLPPKELAKKYLELCIKMPEIQPNNEHYWLNSLPLS
jgi:hypothetical protein